MPRRRLPALLVAVTLALCVTAAWSYYKLAGAGETMLEEAKKFLGTFERMRKIGRHWVRRGDADGLALYSEGGRSP